MATDSSDADQQQVLQPDATHMLLEDPLLLRMIELRYGLLDELRRSNVLSQKQISIMKSTRSELDQIQQLLDAINGLPYEKQEQFLSALDKTQQSHVTNYVRNKGRMPSADVDNWPITGNDQWSRIEHSLIELKELIDTRNGLLDELLSVQCLTVQQKQVISAQLSDADSIELLLDIIQRKSLRNYKHFIDCLTRTKQNHVVALLEPSSSTNSQRVLEQHLTTLTANQVTLVKLINVKHSEFLNQLYAIDGITWQQREFVESATVQSESNRRLLDIVRRGSQSDFNKFIACLKQTGQDHVADVILSQGFVVEIVAKTNLESHDEDAIIQKFLSVYRTTSSQHREELLSVLEQLKNTLNRCEIVAMQTKHSIKLFILCKSRSRLLHLNELFYSQQLKVIIQQFFSSLLENTKQVIVHTLVWDVSEYISAANYFSGLDEQQPQSPVFSGCNFMALIPTDQLPPELTEILLLKAAGQLFFATKSVISRADVYVLATLGSVNRYWWKTLTYRKRNVHLLKQYCERLCFPYRFNPRFVMSVQIPHCKMVRIAELGTRLYVASGESNIIKVLTLLHSSYQLDEDLKVPGLCDPADIVACSVSCCLYLSDWRIRCIWRVKLTNSLLDELSVEKLITTEYEPFTLSVQSSRLVVTALGGATVYVYSCCGELLKKIDQSQFHAWKQIEKPLYSMLANSSQSRYNMAAWHAVETSEGTVIACHEKRWFGDSDPDNSNAVRELSSNGEVVNVSGGSIELELPVYMTMHSQKHFLICDRMKKEIVHVNRQLQIEQAVLSMQQLNGAPDQLCYSEERRLLYVCYCGLSLIDVFKV